MARPAIAIIGVSGRYPGGANDLSSLWNNLKHGIDGIGEAKGDRWDLGYHHPDREQGKIYTRCAGFLDQVDMFDADFFGMSPREAAHVDPQQRLLLELAWEALEDAAVLPKRLAGSDAGVFIGIASHDYGDLQNNLPRKLSSAYTNAGSALSIAANRISYTFDFHGPSMAIDTACSSALVALHQACLSLWSSQCSLALSGGINLLLQPKLSIGFCNASMLSATGRCKSFDAGADGYVRAEGGGIIVLKRLADAERDGDPIRALIIGSGINSDGRTAGLSLPNESAQEALLRRVYGDAGIEPEDVFYVEAHGTGTPAGDPIECNALGRVLGSPRRNSTSCLIGSVKSNIGHLEAAAGIAGVTKLLLSLQHRELPANLHFKTPNPAIAFDRLRLQVVDRRTIIPVGDRPIVMGVSSYGFGGANAHVVIREYQKNLDRLANGNRPVQRAERERVDHEHMMLLSARSPDALSATAGSFAAFLRSAPPGSLDRICATAALCRSQHSHRLAVAGRTPLEMAQRLEQFSIGDQTSKLATARVTGEAPKLAYVCSGNGPQWWGMGQELIATVPGFRAELQRVDILFKEISGWSLIAEMTRSETDSRMSKTEVAQPALFALQLGLAGFLESQGVRPSVVVGHSVGEVAAAHLAGALSLEQAVRVIYERSQAQALTAGVGKMAAVGLDREQLTAAIAEIPGWLEIAAVNSSRSVTVAGASEALEKLGQKMTQAGVFYRLLALDYAFHSTAMDAIESPLRRGLECLKPLATKLPFVSSVEGCSIEGTQLDANYWWRNVRETVRFDTAIDHLLTAAGATVFLEIGPHPVLRDYVLQCAKDRQSVVAVGSTLRRPTGNRLEPEPDNIWTATCFCHANGVADPNLLFTRPAEPAALPVYQWQRARFWNGTNTLLDAPLYSHRDHPLLGYRIDSGDWLWQNALDTTLLPYLGDHVVQGAVLMPAAGFIEMVLGAAMRAYRDVSCDLEDLEIRNALVIPAGQMPIVQLSMTEEDGSVKIRSRSNPELPWTLNVVGRVSRDLHSVTPNGISIEQFRATTTDVIDGANHYRARALSGLSYGPAFRAVEKIWINEREALGEIRVREELVPQTSEYCLHPVVLDACLQVLLALLDTGESPVSTAYLPVQFDHFRIFGTGAEVRFCHVRIRRRGVRSAVADFLLLDREGELIAEIRGGRCRGVDFMRSAPLPLYMQDWQLAEEQSRTAKRPSPLNPSLVAKRIASRIDQLVTQFDRARFYREIQPRFDRLAATYAAHALDQLGARKRPFTIASLMAVGRVNEERRGYLERLVAIAEADGLIDRTSTGWAMPPDRLLPSAELQWQEILRDHPAHFTELALLGRCGEHIVPVLQDDTQAIELLSPDGGGALSDHFYDTAPSSRVYNQIVRYAIAELVRDWPTDCRLRILELGGGTGGLTANLLPILSPTNTDYVFSDISQSYLGRAQQRFNSCRFIRFCTLDIERDPLEQGFTAGSFDVVVAGDVLGFTSDLHRALANARTLLSASGQLILIEKHAEWSSDIILGSARNRGHSATLAPAECNRALLDSGFTETIFLSDAAAVQVGYEVVPPQRSVVLAENSAPSAAPLPIASIHPNDRTWLLLVDRSDGVGSLANATTAYLSEAGCRVITAMFGDNFRHESPDHFVVRPTSAEDFSRLIEEIGKLGLGCDEIVHLAGMTPIGGRSVDSLALLQDIRCVSTLLLLQVLKAPGGGWKPRLTLVTSMAMALPWANTAVDPGQAPLWGLGRVLGNEHPDLRCRLIDLQASFNDPRTANLLGSELLKEDNETEVLLTPVERYVSRVRATSAAEQALLAHRRTRAMGHTGVTCERLRPFRLQFPTHGPVDNLFVGASERRAPDGGEVEIQVRAAGLNFRDVMWVMGMLPEEALENGFAGPTIGMECSGEIVRVGPEVSEFAIGDRVLAFAPSCFSNFVTTGIAAVARIPEDLTLEAAATIPTAFLTAYYALIHLAKLAPGERVLIHGAAGGVGLAAIQIAKWRGAEIFGTAGSPEKRDVLRLVGVAHVLDSRSLEFADEVMRITAGQGVDVVLNSLAGEAIIKNLQILRPFGRFLEIGKRDMYANSKIGLRPFRNNLSYFGIDADTMLNGRNSVARDLIHEVLELFRSGELRPLPYRSFPIGRAVEAFRQMQQSRQIGKLVVTMSDDDVPTVAVSVPPFRAREDGTYLITGGLSGFGLATARWLVSKGARHLALVGRRGAISEEARSGLAALNAAGAIVVVYTLDVSDEAAVASLITRLKRAMPPLRGVIHAAMVIDDGTTMQMNRERMHRVMAPKVLGAWNLHNATLDQPLDFFVLHSSATTFIGNPGQANYVASNMYLEGLAQHRRQRGLPALAISWGAIAEVGYIARNAEVEGLLRKRAGIESISPDQAFSELDRLLGAEATCIGVVRLDWRRLREGLPAASLPRMSLLIDSSERIDPHETSEDLRARLLQLASAERKPFIITELKERIGRVLNTGATHVDEDRQLSDMGIDSLMGVELSEVIERDMQLGIPVMELIQSGSIAVMADRILKSLESRCSAQNGLPTAAVTERAAIPSSLSGQPLYAPMGRTLQM